MTGRPSEPAATCGLCPRLAAFRRDNQAAEPDWYNAPVPSFGEAEGRLAIVGLAPGMRGANRTGRPFTGDFAGDLLYETLSDFGFAIGTYDSRPDDGLKLKKDRPVLLVCDNGARSGRAAGNLRKKGFEQVFSLKGGLQSWRQENLPVVSTSESGA